MRAERVVFIILLILVATTLSGCLSRSGKAYFAYKDVMIEGFNPIKHRPSPEFIDKIKPETILLTNSEIRTIKRCIQMFYDQDLSHLLKLTNKIIVVDCPFSFADKPQSTIYIDREKVKAKINIGHDWDYKLMQFGSYGDYHFKGNPELPNLFRIILHELGHLVEYKKLEFSWKGQFVANDLNRDFVQISWDEKQAWKDRESLLEKLRRVETEEEMLELFRWFKENSAFFSFYSCTGMNEDFAEAFVYYYLVKNYNFTLDLLFNDQTVVENIQQINYSREKKLKFIETVMEE